LPSQPLLDVLSTLLFSLRHPPRYLVIHTQCSIVFTINLCHDIHPNALPLNASLLDLSSTISSHAVLPKALPSTSINNWCVCNIISSPDRPSHATLRAPTRCQSVASPTHRQRLALHAPLLGLSSKSFHHLAIQPTRRIARRRDADASPTRRGDGTDSLPGDASSTRRERVADATSKHRPRLTDASPTPCLKRPCCLACRQYHFLTSPSSQRDASHADASPIRRRRVVGALPTCCTTDATQTRRQRDVDASSTRRRRIANALP
jgi:hypothetical protein